MGQASPIHLTQRAHDQEIAVARLLTSSARSPSYSKGWTVFVIVHRLLSARDTDRVAACEDGLISEFGSHDELVAAGGSYAALWGSWHGKLRAAPGLPHSGQGR